MNCEGMQKDSVIEAAPFGQFAPTGFCALALGVTRRCSVGWFGKRTAFFLRAVAMRSLRGRPVDVVSLGARMRLNPHHNVAEKRLLFTPQYFDAPERALLAERLKGDFVFLDVGASVGGYALSIAALAGPRARILAVEPLPEVFERLVYNIQQSEFANVKAVSCALADIDGEITLFVNTGNQGETSVRIVSAEAHVEQMRVRAKRLLTLVREEGYAKIDAIKLDIEGAEDSGARSLPQRGAAGVVAAPDHHGIFPAARRRPARGALARARLSGDFAHGRERRLRARSRGDEFMSETIITAAILVIGDEILSGRTKDRNIGYIAEYLSNLGIDVREARVVPDVEEEIVAALDALRARYTYVFTTGGIGPTHDDITADAVAKAFGVGIDEHPRVIAMMLERYKPDELTPARRRMARIPDGATLVENPISKVPGFRIGNVIVMAGVPSIMQAMLDSAAKDLETGVRLTIETIEAAFPEGLYGDALGRIAANIPRRASALILPSPTESSRTRSSCAAAIRSKSRLRAARSRRCWPGSAERRGRPDAAKTVDGRRGRSLALLSLAMQGPH